MSWISGGSRPTVILQNSGGADADLGGWTLDVEGKPVIIRTGTRLSAGGSLNLVLGIGTNTATDVFLGTDAYALAVLLLPRAHVTLLDQHGAVVHRVPAP